jgi:hypothetical protein
MGAYAPLKIDALEIKSHDVFRQMNACYRKARLLFESLNETVKLQGEFMRNIRFIVKALLLITISTVLAANAFGQRSDEILVEGNPPFTGSDFESLVKYYERGLDIRFSDEERDEFKSKVAAMWRKNQKSNGGKLIEFMQSVRSMNSRVTDEKIREHQQEFADALLADLKNMSRNGWSDFVVGVYERAQRGDSINAQSDEETPAQTESSENPREADFQTLNGAIRMSDLAGKWVKGTTATYGYRDSVTNDYKSGYGAANQHDIYANGSFDYTNFAQVSLYGCTTELFTSMKGRLSLSGSEVTFNYVSGSVKGKDSCKTTGFNKPAQIRQTTYRLESDGSRLRMCEVGAENPTCLYREK